MAVSEPLEVLLSSEARAWLEAHGREVRVAPGVAVVRRGDPGCWFFLVVEGCLEVRLPAPHGCDLSLARLGPGSTFGEMALLLSEPVSADVVAVGDARLVECDAETFRIGLTTCEPLRAGLLARLAANVRDTSTGTWRMFVRAGALELLIREDKRTGPLIADSAKMRKVETEIAALAGTSDCVTFVGAPGSGRLFAARKLHEASAHTGAPLIVVDAARRTEEGDAGTLQTLLSRPGGGQFSAFHLAHGGTLIIRHVESLDGDLQMEVAASLEELGRLGPVAFPSVRVAVTASDDPATLTARGLLCPELAEHLSAHVVTLPRATERKLDLLPLARLFLGQGGVSIGSLSTEAEHVIVARSYRHRNVAELREAIELAAVFADGGEIRAEHIVTGPKVEGTALEVDLTAMPAMRWLLAGTGMRWLQAVVGAGFAAVVLACLAAPSSSVARVANAVVWGVWEPAIILLFLFLGHVWCAVCPLSTAGLAAKRALSFDRPPPTGLKKSSVVLMSVGFVAIVWSERVFHMTLRPFATGLLLLCLVVAAVGFAVVFQRESWCRYACPLGALAAGYSLSAAVQVRSTPGVCAAYCTSHDCFKGTDGRGGCPVFHHPMYATESHLCKLCLACLSRCPHGSARLYGRPPLQAIWRLGGLSESLAPFAWTVFLGAPLMLASQVFASAGSPLFLGLGAAAAVLAAFVAAARMPGAVGAAGAPDGALAARVAYALMVLGWGPLMAYQAANVPLLREVSVRPLIGSPLAELTSGVGLPAYVIVQVALVLLGWALANLAFSRIRAFQAKTSAPPSRSVFGWLALGSAGYTAVALAIVLAPNSWT